MALGNEVILSWLVWWVSLGVTSEAFSDVSSLEGLPVSSVHVEAKGRDTSEDMVLLLNVKKGALFSREDIRQALKRMYHLGRFSSVQVYAQREGDGIKISFAAQPVWTVKNIVINGLQGLDVEAFLKTLSWSEDQEMDALFKDGLERGLSQWLSQHGYPYHNLQTTEHVNGDRYEVEYHVDVWMGEPQRVVSTEFQTDTPVDKTILDALTWVKKGHVADRARILEDAARLKEAFLEKGFLSVSVDTPLYESLGKDVKVVHRIVVGDRITWDLKGHTVFSTAQLKRMWPQPKEAFSDENMRFFMRAVEKRYKRWGFYNIRTQLFRYRDPDARVSRYVLQIHEGKPSEVEEVMFEGVTAFPVNMLKQQLYALLYEEDEQQGFFEHVRLGDGALAFDEKPADEKYRSLLKTDPLVRWNPAVYAEALSLIASAYRDLGYLSVKIESPEVVWEQGKARVKTVVHEGPQTNIGKIFFEGSYAFDEKTLAKQLKEATTGPRWMSSLQKGSPLSKTGIEEGRIALLKNYRDHGYVYARVVSDVVWGKDPSVAGLVYKIQEGPQVHVENVLLRGHVYTRKNTVLSRLSLKKGDVFDANKTFADQRALLNLGIFSNVRIKLLDEEYSSSKKDVLVDVVERNRHVVEISPGVSTADGLRLKTVYTHSNMFGTGTSLTGSLKINRQVFFGLYGRYADELRDRFDTYNGMKQLTKALEREVRLGVRLPPWTSLPLSPVFRFDVLNERDNTLNYALETAAFIAGADVLLPFKMQISYETQAAMTDLECVRGVDCSGQVQGRRRSIDAGRRWMVKTGPYITYDRRDNPLSPSRGWYANLKSQFAWGAARQSSEQGYDPFKFMRLEAVVTGYVPLGPLVWALSGRIGALRGLGQETVIPLDERFFLGGRDTLRGYMEGSLIPQDTCVLQEQQTPSSRCAEVLYATVKNGKTSPPLSKGGNMYGLVKSELRLPITGDVSLNVFADVGNVWVNLPDRHSLVPRFGVGGGLRYATPVGAVTFDVGVNPSPRIQDRAELRWQYHISIGSF